MSSRESRHEGPAEERRAHHLDDLIPIAVVIAAGCEPCAAKMVNRALDQGCSRGQIARTLEVVSHLRSLECLVQAVGPEVVSRMERPLASGRQALREAGKVTESRGCCG
jgi:Carboxymuconolactone decarboxylase family